MANVILYRNVDKNKPETIAVNPVSVDAHTAPPNTHLGWRAADASVLAEIDADIAMETARVTASQGAIDASQGKHDVFVRDVVQPRIDALQAARDVIEPS